MGITIAVAGKGGTGKTTFAALVVKCLKENTNGLILAVDGDPSSNFHLALGLPLAETVGHIREDTLSQIQKGALQGGISKVDYLELRISKALVEGDRVDLIAMGRPEGPGCYCAANAILRNVIDRLKNDYDYVVIDNEAGMEHISRQTTQNVDVLFVISDPTIKGIMAAKGIVELARELGTKIRKAYLVVNKLNGDLPEMLRDKIQEVGLELIGALPNEPKMAEFDLVGKPVLELEKTSPLYKAVEDILRRAGVIQ
ncbi:MAG: AAA family ATPase [Anaerolineae bacterium]|nr:AAA family ATPase [Anaerolineae bacterium]MDW8102873.1 AAA family ATPase [Anaerolineae bacterium]